MKEKINKDFGVLSIICFIISIIILSINLFGKLESTALTCIGYIFLLVGIIFLIYDNKRNKYPLRGFEKVVNDKRKTDCYHTPTRSSSNSAGYDFYADKDYEVFSNQIVKIWTDVKAFMQPDEFLMLDVRSSMGGNFMLANTIGIIDSDYYSNPDNDGNIGIFLKNISPKCLKIYKGDKIAQGIFMKYLKADNDNTTAKRTGGWGSSGR